MVIVEKKRLVLRLLFSLFLVVSGGETKHRRMLREKKKTMAKTRQSCETEKTHALHL